MPSMAPPLEVVQVLRTERYFSSLPAALRPCCIASMGPTGQEPEGTLVIDAKGNLYGTTFFGGAGTACPGDCGTVFKITP